MIRIAALLLAFATVAGTAHAGEFDDYWHDGKAELDGYRLTVSRYGEERTGTAVMIYVTEPFSESKRVKVDNPSANPDDTFNVLKLNFVRDFQTGIYDYNTMTSLFVRTTDFSPVKVSFSSAEWCGHVYEDLVFKDDRIEGHYFSYFEGESGPIRLDAEKTGVSEENLFILLRGLRGSYLEPGESRDVKLLPSVYFGRLAHKPAGWVDATISRGQISKQIDVPAGRFHTIVYSVKTSDGREGVFYIEDAYPHKIVKWSMLPDVNGELTGSQRLAYWKLNRNGHESHLKQLGLGPDEG